jgi:hypothetical protein
MDWLANGTNPDAKKTPVAKLESRSDKFVTVWTNHMAFPA